jgi:hypothetical protein
LNRPGLITLKYYKGTSRYGVIRGFSNSYNSKRFWFWRIGLIQVLISEQLLFEKLSKLITVEIATIQNVKSKNMSK